MQIKFAIDIDKQIVWLYVRRGELSSWVARALKAYPNWTTEQISKNGSHAIACATSEALNHVSRIAKVDVMTFHPEFVMYQKNYELPIQLR